MGKKLCETPIPELVKVCSTFSFKKLKDLGEKLYRLCEKWKWETNCVKNGNGKQIV